MAESIVQVTEGSGKKLHTFQRTIGANNVEDEVILHGEPYLATYCATFASTSIATANDHVLQLMAGASLNLYVRRILIFQAQAATTAGLVGWAICRLTTAGTGGTAGTPSPLDSTDAASGATAMTLPTVKGTEGTFLWREFVQTIQTVPTGGVAKAPTMLDIDFDRMRTKGIRIPAGTANGMAVKLLTASAGASVYVDVLFSEANF